MPGRRLALAIVVLSAVLAPPAAAQEPLTPAPDAKITRGGLPWFSALAPEAREVHFLVSASPARTGGLLAANVAHGEVAGGELGTFGWRLPENSIAAIRPGRYWWQPAAIAANGSVAFGPVRSFEVSVPGADRPLGRIPGTIGRQGSGAFALSTRGIPRGISRERLWTVVSRSARRWGLRAAGWTNARPARGDGYNVLGFGRLPRSSFGVTRTLTATRFRGNRVLGRVILERDVTINNRFKWEAGPDYPWLDEADLETTVLHELGHFAGNDHVRMCVPSPMVIAGDLGDWWRSPSDYFVRGCIRVS